MFPSVNQNHVQEGLALLTSRYANAPVLQGLLTAYLNRIQDLENVLWGILNAFILANNPTGDQLLQLAKLVGQAPDGLTSADLLLAVKLRIAANTSQGRAEDIIKMAASLGVYNYVEAWPAAFLVEVWNPGLSNPQIVGSLFSAAKDPGVYANLHYSTGPSSQQLKFSSIYAPSAGNGVLASSYTTVPNAGLLCATVVL